jgi:hypothetical protein
LKQTDLPKHILTEETQSSSRELGLEEIIRISNTLGLEYADKRKDAERLELLRTSIRAQIMNRIERESPKTPEARLKRLAEADEEYIEVLQRIAHLRGETEKLRIRYESYKSLFDARRTLISYKKVEMKSL